MTRISVAAPVAFDEHARHLGAVDDDLRDLSRQPDLPPWEVTTFASERHRPMVPSG